MKGNSTLKVTKFFFDAPKILASVDEVAVKVLSRFGAFVRRTAKSSIRKSKKSSDPGSPPRSHTGFLKDFIFFAYDPETCGVVIGPEKGNQVSFTTDMRPITGTVPHSLEYGGTAFVLEEWNSLRWQRRNLRRRGSVSDVGALRESGKSNVFNNRPIRKRPVRVAARPFMRPALAKEAPGLPAMWKNSIKS